MPDTLPITAACPLLPPKAAARYLSVSLGTLRTMVRDGRLPAPVRLSERRIAFDPADLARFVAASRGSR